MSIMQTVGLSVAQLPQHTHSLQAQDDAASVGTSGGHYLARQDRPNIYDSDSDKLVSLGQKAIGAAGGGQPHDNMQPFLVLNFVIALVGVYPERS